MIVVIRQQGSRLTCGALEEVWGSLTDRQDISYKKRNIKSQDRVPERRHIPLREKGTKESCGYMCTDKDNEKTRHHRISKDSEWNTPDNRCALNGPSAGKCPEEAPKSHSIRPTASQDDTAVLWVQQNLQAKTQPKRFR